MMRPATPDRGRTLAALGPAAAIIATLALAACSPSHPQPAKTHVPSATSGSAPAGPAQAPTANSNGQADTNSAQVGAALAVSDSSGTKLDVTVEQVIDSAGGASQYGKPASGRHFVGVKLRVQNKATTTYQNNANNETTIVLTDGKTDAADYNPITGCGNFDNGQVKLAAGASVTGCVTFQVPNGEKVTEVHYGNTVFPGTTAQWNLP